MRFRAADYLWENPVLLRGRPRRGPSGSVLRSGVAWLSMALLLALYAAAAHWLSDAERSPWDARLAVWIAGTAYLVVISVLVPAVAGGLISGERERNTLEALRLTALSPAQTVAGKLLLGLRPAALAFAVAFPLLAMALHAGRFSPEVPLLVLLVLTAPALALTAVSLWLSGRCRTTRAAVAWTYLLVGCAWWASLASTPVLAVRREDLWWYASPVWHLALLCFAEPVGAPLARPLLPEWAWLLLGCALVTCLSLVFLHRRLAAAEAA